MSLIPGIILVYIICILGMPKQTAYATIIMIAIPALILSIAITIVQWIIEKVRSNSAK
jgi:hypothetical protein